MDNRQSCFARLLDVRGYVVAARAATASAPPGANLAMVAVFFIIALVLTPIWVVFDLQSTWDFTSGLRASADPVVYQMGEAVDKQWETVGLGATMVAVILTGFTLLPSLFELAFPMVNHPLLRLILIVSIVFDYITDWGKAATVAAEWSENPIVSFIATALFCAFVSVGVQALLVICITVVIYGAMGIIRGGSGAARAVVIDG